MRGSHHPPPPTGQVAYASSVISHHKRPLVISSAARHPGIWQGDPFASLGVTMRDPPSTVISSEARNLNLPPHFMPTLRTGATSRIHPTFMGCGRTLVQRNKESSISRPTPFAH
jgi:hypothetical protein